MKKSNPFNIKSDVEAFEKKAMNLVVAIEDLRKSRDLWRRKFEDLKQEVNKMSEDDDYLDDEENEED